MRDEYAGLIIMIAATLFFSFMNIFVKITLAELPFMETVFFRGVFGTIFVVMYLLSQRKPLIGPRPFLLSLRGLLGFLGLSCYYFTMSKLTLADTVILNRISPLFVMILSYFILKEILSRWHVVVLLMAMVGIFNIVQPQMDFAPIAGLIGLLSSVFSAGAYIVVKKLSSDHNAFQIVLAFVFLSALLSVPFLFNNFMLPDGPTWLLLADIGFTSALAQILMTKAYALGSPTPVSIASYGIFIFSALWGYLLWGEIQNPQALIGSGIVITCMLSLPFLNRRVQAIKSEKRIRPVSEV
ncbi:DMT family transporter [bacterium]|nr:DMT family transporter [candidate division CSSED10-310 bacterium]